MSVVETGRERVHARLEDRMTELEMSLLQL